MKHLLILSVVLLAGVISGYNSPAYIPDGKCIECHSDLFDKKWVHEVASEGCDFCHIANGLEHPGDEPAFSFESSIAEMCYMCHEAQNSMSNVHYPVSEGECTLCHSPHAGDYRGQLIAAYPAQLYTQASIDSFDLCFQCHDSELMTSESTDYATNFRNGTNNLHFVHLNGNRARSCSMCHGLHSASKEHMLNEKVEFGKWDMPMGLELTDNGGSCATGCHKRLEYER